MRIRKKIVRLVKARRGTTLVELMVSFVLTAILMTAAIAVISPATKVFYRVLEMSHAQGVTDIVLEEISGELESAGKILSIDGPSIKYTDQKGQGVVMSEGSGKSDDGQELAGMLILYYGDEDITWYLPRNTYMGLQIAELTFQQVGEKNLIEVRLSLKNRKGTMVYERTKVVECYKLGEGPMGS